MTELVAPARRADAASSLLAAGGFAALAVVVVGAGPPTVLAAAVAGSLFLAAVAVKRPVISWTGVLTALLLVVLFIPIRRYRMPVDLPFQLEPYRVLVILIVGGWAASLLVDRRVRLRRSGLEGPVAAVMLTTVASILVNGGRVSELQSTVLKSLTFLLSFGIVFYLVVSVVRRRAIADALAKTFVAGGAVVALLAVLEARTGVTPFTRLHAVFPILVPDPSFDGEIGRGGALRAFGPAEHPIALGAALVLLVPLAIYVVRVSSPAWSIALVALVVGILSTVSRTGILMLFAIALVFLWLRPRETRRLWPLLVPMLVITHFAVPGTLGSLKQAFLPEEGLIEEQRGSEGSCSSAGRVADLAPTLAEVSEKPFLGYGFGTRITTGPDSNACILDNQWLGTLLEVGVVGALAWLWLFLGVLRRFGRVARGDPSPTGWLLAAVTASMTAYAVGMFTYDALGFVQVTFFLFIILGLGAAVGANRRGRAHLGGV
jgi:hypothetical protein